jgi:hypothetical protein
VLDDLSTGSERNVAHLRARRDFHLIVDSVLKSSVVNELVHRCDVVFHLAAAVGVRLIVEEPVRPSSRTSRNRDRPRLLQRIWQRVLVASTSRSTVTGASLSRSSRTASECTGRRRRDGGRTRSRRHPTSSSRSHTTRSAASTA